MRGYGLRCQRFQAIFVVQSYQYWGCDDSVTSGDLMPVRPRTLVERHGGNARTEAGVRSTLMVVSHPLLQNPPKMPFIQQDQPIRTLTTDGTNEPLAKRVGLRALRGCLQDRQTHRLNRAIDGRRIDAVAIVNEETLRLVAGHNPAELLDRPFGRRVLRSDPVRAHFGRTPADANVCLLGARS